MLTTADLAAREELTLGGVIVSPSTRHLRGPNGSVDIEPRVMQVLVVLADAAGEVVTRETLFTRCWGGVYVGDDSLNRAVGALRRAVAAVGGRFEIETIPRTGYLLTVPKGHTSDLEGEPTGHNLSRRRALGAGAASAVLTVTGLWWRSRSESNARFEALLQNGQDAVYKGKSDRRTVQMLQQAVSMRPGSARAWGLLALVTSFLAQSGGPEASASTIERASGLAHKALSVDPQEPNALLAMFELQGGTLDLLTRDQRLRQILSIDSDNLLAISELVLLLQGAGLNRASWNWNERGLAIDPLSPDLLPKRALKLWIAGRVSAADKVIDQARALRPSDPWPWFVRFLILALTDRTRAARAMSELNPAMIRSPLQASFWVTCLAALEQRSVLSIAQAGKACRDGARLSGELAGQGVMIMSALGDVDAAFDITNGFLLSRGSVVRADEAGSRQAATDALLRLNTQWLFTPPAAAMRKDMRFRPLCEGLGLTEYWRKRGVRPDYLSTER
jgi:DNA-binding winged helix-turn-helix (wHTH) protein